MKIKPEYRDVFTSPGVFARVLHILSTQKYKLPVRRYILDLFDISLDVDTVKAISDARNSMQVMPSAPSTTPNPRPARMRAFSVIGRPRADESDDDNSDEDAGAKPPIPNRPVMSLRPMSTIVGFD